MLLIYIRLKVKLHQVKSIPVAASCMLLVSTNTEGLIFSPCSHPTCATFMLICCGPSSVFPSSFFSQYSHRLAEGKTAVFSSSDLQGRSVLKEGTHTESKAAVCQELFISFINLK